MGVIAFAVMTLACAALIVLSLVWIKKAKLTSRMPFDVVVFDLVVLASIVVAALWYRGPLA